MEREKIFPAPCYFLQPSSIQTVIFVYILAHLYSLSQKNINTKNKTNMPDSSSIFRPSLRAEYHWIQGWGCYPGGFSAPDQVHRAVWQPSAWAGVARRQQESGGGEN